MAAEPVWARPRLRRRALALCLWLAASAAGSQGLPSRMGSCAACHGADGNSALQGIPSLAGQPRVFLENQLILIREGLREIAAMKGQLDGWSDADIAALARHYAAQPLRPTAAARDAALFEQGRQMAGALRCGACHLSDYQGREQMPRLAGQREDYLLLSMRQFRAGQASGRDTQMSAALYGVPDADLQALAHYLAHYQARVAP